MIWTCSPWLAPPELLNWPLTLLLPQGEEFLAQMTAAPIIHSLGAPCSQPPPVPRLWERSPVEVQPRKVIYQSAFKHRL